MALKNTKRILSFILSVSVVLSCFMMAGCAQKDEEQVLRGLVCAEEPIVGAAVSIYDTSGKQLLKSQKLTTNENGAILLGASVKLPSEFRVVAEGGTQNGEAFASKLITDVRNYNPETDTIYVNLATTLVAAYIDKSTDKSFDDASAAVKKFLNVPGYLNLASGAHLTSEDFNIGQFLTEAAEKGGINPFIDALITEMDAGKKHPFQNELPLQSIGSELALAFAKGAATYVGGEAMGWGLELVGMDYEENRTEDEIAEIKQGIADMQSELAEMNTKLDALSDKMDGIVDQLNDMLKKIVHQQRLSEYNTRVETLNVLLSNISSIQSKINSFIQTPPPKTARESRIKTITDLVSSRIIGNEDVIHNALVGVGGSTPLITLWREIVYEDRFLDWEDYAIVKSQYDFFRQYQDALLMIQVEYYHATEDNPGDNKDLILDAIDKYEDQLTKQEALLAVPIIKDMVIDTDWGLMFYGTNMYFDSTKLYNDDKETYPKIGSTEIKKIMNEMVESNPGSYFVKDSDGNDTNKIEWETLDYDGIGGPIQGHTFNNYKSKKVPWNLSDFLVENGWPGEVVKAPMVVPFSGKPGQEFSQLVSDGSHFDRIFELTASDKVFDSPYLMIMIYRWTTDKEIGYEHYKDD